MPVPLEQSHRQRAKQKRTAIHMLAMSGVIRPGNIEPRYTTPIWKVPTPKTSPYNRPIENTQSSSLLDLVSTMLNKETNDFLKWLGHKLPFKKATVTVLAKKGFNPYLLTSNSLKS